MLRAMAKGAGLLACGRIPGGAGLYRRITRDWLGSQASHVDKLQRVLPGYAAVWRERCGVTLEAADVWVHEAGWTPFSGFAIYLLTGKGGVLTNGEVELHDRYLTKAVNGVLAARWPEGLVTNERRRRIEALRWEKGSHEALEAVGTRLIEEVRPGRIPLADASIDLVHSGGALEHLSPEELDRFLAESRRILRPGGVASHVFDHRDHLYHADKRWPFLAHQAWPDPVYRALFGHSLMFHSRLLPEEICRRFEAAGFERIVVRRLVMPEGRYATEEEVVRAKRGLPERLNAWRREPLSELDLRTAAAHYLFRAK
ncbi:MAG TPA: methyltransferase domain-containing protein [Myxococcales bacterium]|jgi:SAM-dependent methyltransferase